jgi:hypothetical protein
VATTRHTPPSLGLCLRTGLGIALIPIGFRLIVPANAGPLEGTSFAFATIEEGKKVLTEDDDFVSRLSPFDRAARMKTDKEISKTAYLDFVGRNVLAWQPEEKAAVQSALAEIRPQLATFSLSFPSTIYVIKTTGMEEGNAEYTRGNAIVLPQSALERGRRESLPPSLRMSCFMSSHVSIPKHERNCMRSLVSSNVAKSHFPQRWHRLASRAVGPFPETWRVLSPRHA